MIDIYLISKVLMTSAILISFFSDPEAIEISFTLGISNGIIPLSSDEVTVYYIENIMQDVLNTYDGFGVIDSYKVIPLDGGESIAYTYFTDTGWNIAFVRDWEGSLDITIIDPSGEKFEHLAIYNCETKKYQFM